MSKHFFENTQNYIRRLASILPQIFDYVIESCTFTIIFIYTISAYRNNNFLIFICQHLSSVSSYQQDYYNKDINKHKKWFLFNKTIINTQLHGMHDSNNFYFKKTCHRKLDSSLFYNYELLLWNQFLFISTRKPYWSFEPSTYTQLSYTMWRIWPY